MFPYNTPQQQATTQNKYVLANGAMRLIEQTQEVLLPHHWICTGCGTTHARQLPEECQSCGATALEFEYALPRAR
jgi:rubrerythrin